MSGGERGISEKKASLATLAAGLFYIGADSVRQFSRTVNTSGSSAKDPDHAHPHCPVYTGFKSQMVDLAGVVAHRRAYRESQPDGPCRGCFRIGRVLFRGSAAGDARQERSACVRSHSPPATVRDCGSPGCRTGIVASWRLLR